MTIIFNQNILELAKAFDTVNHVILFRKLENYGIEKMALEFITNNLINRIQSVWITI